MKEILLIIYFAAAFYVLFQGIYKQPRLIEFPCVSAFVYIGYLGVQMVGLFHFKINSAYYCLGVFMCFLCMVMGNWGYYSVNVQKLQQKIPMGPYRYTVKSITVCGVVLLVIGLFGVIRMANLMGGFAKEFLQGGHYRAEWNSTMMIYNLLAKNTYLGCYMLFWALLRSFSVKRLILFCISTVYPLTNMLLLGRRNIWVGVSCTILAIYILVTKKYIKPLYIWIAYFIALALIILAPLYRDYTSGLRRYKGDLTAAVMNDYQRHINKHVEMTACMMYVGACWDFGIYTYGLNIIDCFVSNFVPRSLVGSDVKDSLMSHAELRVTDYIAQRLNYMKNPSSFKTGPGSAFMMFSFFGSILFFIFGRIYGISWNRMQILQSDKSMLFYIFNLNLIPLLVCFALENVIVLLFINYVTAALCHVFLKKEETAPVTIAAPSNTEYFNNTKYFKESNL